MGKKKNPLFWLDGEGGSELLHAEITVDYWKRWCKALRAYVDDPKDFFKAHEFLMQHPSNQRLAWGSPDGWFHENLWWHVTHVDPSTKRIEDDEKRNTELQVWIEWGPYIEASCTPHVGPDGIASHDPRVDTGGATFEEAIVNLAHNVWKLYGAKPDVPNDAKLKKKDRW